MCKWDLHRTIKEPCVWLETGEHNQWRQPDSRRQFSGGGLMPYQTEQKNLTSLKHVLVKGVHLGSHILRRLIGEKSLKP